jgi:hypothetical protein
LPLSRIEPRFLGCVFRSLAANRLWYLGSTVKTEGPIDGFYEHFSKYYFKYKVENFLATCNSISLFIVNSNMKFRLQITASGFLQLSYTVSIP